MAATAQDIVNRELREFKRYTGDDLPNPPVNAPLPVGDPQSGVWNPKKASLRSAMLAVIEGGMDEVDRARQEADRAHDEADRSETAADVAAGIATAVLDPKFGNLASARAFHPDGFPDQVTTYSYSHVFDRGGAQYSRYGVDEPTVPDRAKWQMTLSDGVTSEWYVLDVNVPNVRQFGAAGDGVTDDYEAISQATTFARQVAFPVGDYYTKTTIIAGPFARWLGEVPQSSYNTGPRVRIYSTLADLGHRNPIVKVNTQGTSSQSFVFRDIEFAGDLAVDFADLSGMSDQGIVGVDISGAKNGTEFVQCSFRNLHEGYAQLDGSPYCDKVTATRCHFNRNYLAINANPTAGNSLVDCFIYDCFDWIRSTTDVKLTGCSLNNSNFSSETCGITARNILMIGGWTEGGNRVFRPSNYAGVFGVYASETYSQGGATKFLFSPQNDNVTIEYHGSRVPTNTRLIDFAAVTDQGTMTVDTLGLYGGTGFGNVSSIVNYQGVICYSGRGNTNSPLWNGAPQQVVTFSGNRTISAADLGKILRETSGTGSTITIPANANVSLPVGAEVEIVNASGSASHTITSVDDIFHSAGTGSRTLGPRGSIKLKKTAGTVWHVVSAIGVS